MVRMVAGLGGFLNRKSDGFPGPQTLWIGLQRAADFVLAMDAQRGIGEGRYGELSGLLMAGVGVPSTGVEEGRQPGGMLVA